MDLPVPVQGLVAMRAGVGLTVLTAPSALALSFGLPPADARRPMAAVMAGFFGVRELALAALTAGASGAEPQARRRVLLACAATDGLDLAVVGVRAIRQPRLRRAVLLFGPAAVLSVVLHVLAASKVDATP